jgi:NADPH2:quinone reductase
VHKAVRFHQAGGPEVMRLEDVEVGDPGPGEARVRHVAVGLNFADTYFRSGLYPAELPNGIGVEAAGVVEAVGPGVTNVAAGDRVAYTGSPLGAYSTARVMPAGSLVKLPDAIAFETAAGMMMRGLTSSYLMRRIWPLKAGDTILLHAAAGGVGLIVSQWAKLLGLTVIGTVSTEAKAEVARAHGCDHVILYSQEDVAQRVRELTGGEGVPARLGQRRQGHLPRLAQGRETTWPSGQLRHRLGPRDRVRPLAACYARLSLCDPPGARRLHRRPC